MNTSFVQPKSSSASVRWRPSCPLAHNRGRGAPHRGPTQRWRAAAACRRDPKPTCAHQGGARGVRARRFLRARISDIAARAGVAHGSFYSHFDDTEHALAAVLETGWTDVQLLSAVGEAAGPRKWRIRGGRPYAGRHPLLLWRVRSAAGRGGWLCPEGTVSQTAHWWLLWSPSGRAVAARERSSDSSAPSVSLGALRRPFARRQT